MGDKQNQEFMNDPRRIAAEKELDDIVKHIQCNLKFDGNAMYYLTTLPPLLKKLEAAYENLSVVEATIIARLQKEDVKCSG